MYQQSFHGNLVFTKDADKAPLCADCHDAHNIIPPGTDAFRRQSVAMCAKCHCGAETTYLDSYHGKAFVLGDAKTAVCYDCHGGHKHPAGLRSGEHRLQAERRRDVRQVPSRSQRELRRLQGARQSAGPALVAGDLVLLDRLRPAHRRRVQLRGVHTSLYIYRGWQGGPVLAGPPPRAGPQGRQRASSIAASTSSIAGCTSSSSSASPCSCSRACRSSTRTPHWAQWFMDLFGGVTAAGVYHRLAAIVTVVVLDRRDALHDRHR